MDPAAVVEKHPELVFGKHPQVGHHRDQHALDALIVQRQ